MIHSHPISPVRLIHPPKRQNRPKSPKRISKAQQTESRPRKSGHVIRQLPLTRTVTLPLFFCSRSHCSSSRRLPLHLRVLRLRFDELFLHAGSAPPDFRIVTGLTSTLSTGRSAGRRVANNFQDNYEFESVIRRARVVVTAWPLFEIAVGDHVSAVRTFATLPPLLEEKQRTLLWHASAVFAIHRLPDNICEVAQPLLELAVRSLSASPLREETIACAI